MEAKSASVVSLSLLRKEFLRTPPINASSELLSQFSDDPEDKQANSTFMLLPGKIRQQILAEAMHVDSITFRNVNVVPKSLHEARSW